MRCTSFLRAPPPWTSNLRSPFYFFLFLQIPTKSSHPPPPLNELYLDPLMVHHHRHKTTDHRHRCQTPTLPFMSHTTLSSLHTVHHPSLMPHFADLSPSWSHHVAPSVTATSPSPFPNPHHTLTVMNAVQLSLIGYNLVNINHLYDLFFPRQSSHPYSHLNGSELRYYYFYYYYYESIM